MFFMIWFTLPWCFYSNLHCLPAHALFVLSPHSSWKASVTSRQAAIKGISLHTHLQVVRMTVSEGCYIVTSNSEWYIFFSFRFAPGCTVLVIFENLLLTAKLFLLREKLWGYSVPTPSLWRRGGMPRACCDHPNGTHSVLNKAGVSTESGDWWLRIIPDDYSFQQTALFSWSLHLFILL